MSIKYFCYVFAYSLCISLHAQKVDYSLWNSVLQDHVSNEGQVDYKALQSNSINLDNYLKLLSKTSPDTSWSKQQSLAFWINAYNAMTINLVLRHYPLKSIKDIKNPWGQRIWRIGDKLYNLEDIEHQILRKMDEPRIHFAIVCASISCPKLQNEAFQASKIDTQLTKATKEFLADTNRNNISKYSLELSKIFQWFSKDFKQNGSLIDFLNQYADIEISDKAKIKFKDYNWNLNE
jgi:hypothetical protein